MSVEQVASLLDRRHLAAERTNEFDCTEHERLVRRRRFAGRAAEVLEADPEVPAERDGVGSEAAGHGVATQDADHPGHPTVRGMGEGATIADRYSHLDALHDAGLLPMASADPGTVSIGPLVYGNTAADASYMFSWCAARDVPVHVSVFEPGFLRAVLGGRSRLSDR